MTSAVKGTVIEIFLFIDNEIVNAQASAVNGLL